MTAKIIPLNPPRPTLSYNETPAIVLVLPVVRVDRDPLHDPELLKAIESEIRRRRLEP